MDIILTSLYFIGAQVAKKPTSEFADLVWGYLRRGMLKALGHEPTPADVTPAAVRGDDHVEAERGVCA
ncbi:MAG: hypothetical protein ABI880_08780 [Acidobacteriota bacterium]